MKRSTTFAERAFQFYCNLIPPGPLPGNVTVMNPYGEPGVRRTVKRFLDRYFSDNRRRILVFGINPGRFGAGITGVTFTDPVALETFCGIPNDLPKRREPSSVFVYAFAERFGGPARLFRDFFLTAVSPLGFTKDGRNYNFYDDPALFRATKPFIAQSLRDQVSFGVSPHAVIVLGRGKNRAVFESLNREFGFFEKIFTLDHPRFIVQYRRPKFEEYLHQYEQTFLLALEQSGA
ncbi:MAG: uracil-DNA glycosylase family protein [Thermodesulfobacteriota bacterium]